MTRFQLHQMFCLVGQYISRPEIGILGAYHGANIGDMALGGTMLELLENANRSSLGLQTIHNFKYYPECKKYIVGGGALIDNSKVEYIRKNIKPEDIAFVGCEISNARYVNEEISGEALDYLKRSSFSSIRNRVQLERYFQIDDGVELQPDLVFGWNLAAKLRSARIKANRTSGIAGISVMIGCGRDSDGHSRMAERSSEDEQGLNEWTIAYFRECASKALREGKEVHHYPFAYHDMESAAVIFEGMPVVQHSYMSRPDRMAAAIAKCDYFFASRLHSLIFALVLGVPVYPFFYARKNYWMRDDFFPEMSGLGYREYREYKGDRQLSAYVDAMLPFTASDRVLSEMADMVRKSLYRAIEHLYVSRY